MPSSRNKWNPRYLQILLWGADTAGLHREWGKRMTLLLDVVDFFSFSGKKKREEKDPLTTNRESIQSCLWVFSENLCGTVKMWSASTVVRAATTNSYPWLQELTPEPCAVRVSPDKNLNIAQAVQNDKKKISLETAFKKNSSLMGNIYFLLLTVPVAIGGVCLKCPSGFIEGKILLNKKLIWVICAVCSVTVKSGLELLNCSLHCCVFCLHMRFLSEKSLGAVALDSAKPSCCFGVSPALGIVCVWVSVCMCGLMCVLI